MTIKVGGLPIELTFNEEECYDVNECRKLGYIGNNLNLNYVSKLVSYTYGSSPELKQAVLDSLSPFQLASKVWASNCMRLMLQVANERDAPVDQLVYIGSWFGQQHVMANLYLDDQIPALLIDKDPSSGRIADQCIAESRITNVKFKTLDIADFDWDSLSESSMVIWTGCEHFDPKEIERATCDHDLTDQTWILQGTDMPAVDHINLITTENDLAKYFYTDPVYLGKMSTPLGNRFMVAF